jgi:hypothetical protein
MISVCRILRENEREGDKDRKKKKRKRATKRRDGKCKKCDNDRLLQLKIIHELNVYSSQN